MKANSKSIKEKYKFLKHTADVKFQAFGKTIEEAFLNSALALKEVIAEKIKIAPAMRIGIFVEGKDKEALLYNFLEEFLYLLDAERFILSKVENIQIKKDGKKNKYTLKAEALGDLASNYKFSNDVKAVTYSEMFVKKIGKDFVCQVVLDV